MEFDPSWDALVSVTWDKNLNRTEHFLIDGRTNRGHLLTPCVEADSFAKQETLEETFVDL